MATPYEDVYGVFLGKITDYSILNYDQQTLNDEMLSYLNSACARFESFEKEKADSRDDLMEEFTKTLSYTEIEILANLMLLSWVSPKINNIELLKIALNSKDYAMYSQANHLNTLINLKKTINKDCQYLMQKYSQKNILKK